MKTKVSAKEQAEKFVSECNKLGWQIHRIGDEVVTITKRFTPGDRDGFVTCDMEYYGLLALCPNKGGSVWGTDGGGMGALSAMQSGFFRMNKSGSGAVRFASEVRKILLSRR